MMHLTSAGLSAAAVSSGYRPIRSGAAYDTLLPRPDKQDRIIIEDGEVNDTVSLMGKVVWKYLDDTSRLAPLLQKGSLEATCRALWEFIYHHIQYRLDKRGVEQLRRPARSWQERRAGVDCDCMSIFASSVLTNLKIPHSFRVTRYSADHWQHVYVVVPAGAAGEYIIDGVLSRFNYEKPYKDKMDYPMSMNGMNIAVLSGVPAGDLHDAVMAPGLAGDTPGGIDLDAIYHNLVATRSAIAQNPMLVASTDDPQALLQMLDYAIRYFYTDKRDEALAILAQNEHTLNVRSGAVQGTDDDELGAVSLKNFFNSVKTAVSNAGKAVGNAAKAVVGAVVKYNPVSIVARSGYLLALKLNVAGMSSKLKWAYGTQQQAAAKGVSAADYQRARMALTRVEALFADKLKGSKTALQNAILKGKAGGLSAVEGLGEPATTAAAIAAAAPLIIATINILKETGLIGENVKVDAGTIAWEVSRDPAASEYFSALEREAAGQGPEYQLPQTNNNPNMETGTNNSGVVGWVKANPIPTVAIAGVVGLILYNTMSKSGKSSGGLSGYKRRRKARRTKALPAGRRRSRSRRVQKVLIK